MKTVSIRRKILLFLLVMVLAAPWVSAAGSEHERPRTLRGVELAVPEFFSRIWSLVREGRSKEGCNIDPWGRCVLKEGCHIDPNGRCLPLAQPKTGCHIDPNGRCVPTTQPKVGCGIDPLGHCKP